MNKNYETIGINIRKLRKEKKITQKKLGQAIGVDHSFISMIEKGRTKISLDNLLKIAKFFDVPISEITGESETEKDISQEVQKGDIYTMESVLNLIKGQEEWYLEGEKLSKESVKDIEKMIETLIEMKKYDIRKTRS